MQKDNQLKIVVLVPKEQQEYLQAIDLAEEITSSLLEGAGFGGGGDFFQVVCTIGSAGIGALVAIMRARLAQSKNVSIEVEGMKVKGADPDKVESILKMMLKARKESS